MDDQRLLREFTEHGSQAAFSELSRRHIRLVYSTCLRELGDAEPAQDAAQVVFLLLARKARSLRGHAHLPGWLFHTSRLAAKNIRKQERRRALREQTVIQQTAQDNEQTPSEWDALDPHLNDALASLSAVDRDAMLLRFFEGCTLADVGSQLGTSEDAARKRVDRALGKMRDHFARHGVFVPAAALALLLGAHAAKAVPAGCAAAVQMLSGSAVAGSAVSACAGAKIAQLTQGVINAMTITTLKTAAVLALGCVGAAGLHEIASRANASVKTSTGAGQPVKDPSAAKAPQPDPRVLALLNKVRHSADAKQSLTADFTYTTVTPHGDTVVNKQDVGAVRLLKPNFADITYDVGSKFGRRIVSDGGVLWSYGAAANQFQKTPADPDGKNINVWRLITIGGFFSVYTWIHQGVYVRDLSELTYAGKETVNGEEYEVLEHKMTGYLQGKPCPFDQKVFIGSDYLVHRYTLNFTIDGKPGSEVAELTNVKTGEPMTPDSFVFTPPPGAQEETAPQRP